MNDWGPFSDLAALLARAAPPHLGGLAWPRALAAAGGLAEASVGLLSQWPASLPPTPGSFVLSRRFRRGRPPDPAQLAAQVLDCAGWLAARSLRFLMPYFAPFWGELTVRRSPVDGTITPGLADLGAVSPQAIVWALAAWEVDNGGPSAWWDHLAVGPAAALLGPPAGPADALCLHLNIEALVISLPTRLRLPAPPPAHRPPGGLRNPAFLAAYATLVTESAPKIAKDWLKVVQALSAYSPLTQLVYADLVEARPPSGLAAPVSAALTAFQGEPAWWRDLWSSHLARSLLAALLGAPPAQGDLNAAEDHLKATAAAAAAWAARGRARWGRFAGSEEHYPPYGRARRKRDRLRSQVIAEFHGRAVRVGALLAPTPGHSPTPYLHVRLLDLLMRHVITTALPELTEMWQQRQASLARAEVLLADEAGPGLRAFSRILFGDADPSHLPALPPATRRELNEAVRRLLNRPMDMDPEALAGGAGGLAESARRLVARFVGDVGAVTLPFPAPDDRAPAPGSLLADAWLPALERLLVAPEETRTTVAQVRTGG